MTQDIKAVEDVSDRGKIAGVWSDTSMNIVGCMRGVIGKSRRAAYTEIRKTK
jgi:hypothetical protein